MPLLRQLRENYPDDYKNYLRMDSTTFDKLLELVGPKIVKQDTVMRQSISPEERLTATLRFLATGRSLQDLSFTTDIGTSTLCDLIPETCKAMFESLKGESMKFPTSKEEWLNISKGFQDRWHFINCGGALDVLMALVNSNYEFIFVDVGKNGRLSDGGVIEYTDFYDKLMKSELSLPDNFETVNNLNYVFMDEAFSLHEHFFKTISTKGT
nr:uncharacterized protein LOC111415891 isoform X1 [Onthophagus taurus]